MKALLDTHAAVFLWEGRAEVFGAASREVLETHTLLLSPISRLELAFLHEIGRIQRSPDEIVGGLEADCGVVLTSDLLPAVILHAMNLTWTRDPFDRLIVATALLHDARLVTRDRTVQEHFASAVW